MATPSWLEPIETKQTDIPSWLEPVAPRSSLDQSRYTITGATGWDTIPEDAALQTIDSETGKRVGGTKKFNQFVSPETPLSEAPKSVAGKREKKTYGNKFDPSKGETYPDYRAGLEQFIRSQGKRNIGREMIEGVPFAGSIADAGLGIYNDPIYPQRTSEKLLGPELNSDKPLKQAANFAERLITKAPQFVEGAIKFIPETAMNLTRAGAKDIAQAIYDPTSNPESNLTKEATELTSGLLAPLGGKDVEHAYKTGEVDYTFPKTRETFEADPHGSLMMATGIGKGVGKQAFKAETAMRGVPELYTKARDAFQDPVASANKAAKNVQDWGSRVLRPAKGAQLFGGFANEMDARAVTATALHDAVASGKAKFLDKNGELVEGRMPETRLENLQVFEQMMPDLWKEYTDGLVAAGKDAKISYAEDIARIEGLINEWSTQPDTMKWVPQATEVLNRLKKGEEGGGLNISRLPEALKNWGKEKPGQFDPNNGFANEVIDPLMKSLTDRADAFIEANEGTNPQSQAARKKWAQARQFQKSVIADANKSIKDTTKTSIGFLDSTAAVGGLASLFHMSPKGMALSLGIEGMSYLRKKMNHPDRPIKKMYQSVAEQKRHEARIKRPAEVPTGEGPSSPLLRPEDMEPTRHEQFTSPSDKGPMPPKFTGEGKASEPMIERGEARGPAEYDPSLRDIAPPGDTGVTPRQIEQSGQQFRAGGPPKGIPNAEISGGAGQTLTEAPSDYGQTRTLRGPQTGEPLDLNSARAGLREAGFPATGIEDMISATRPPTVESTVAKQGKGAAGVAKTAAKYGVPAAAIAMYLSGDEETKKRMLALPVMAGMMKMVSKEHAANRAATYEMATKALQDAGMKGEFVPGKYESTYIIKDAQGNPVLNKYGKPYGAKANFENGEWMMREIEIPESIRNKKIGTAIYQAFADNAAKNANRFSADMLDTSKDAVRSWEGLERRGYEVERHPDMQIDPQTGSAVTDGFNSPFTIPGTGKKMSITDAAKKFGVPAAAVAAYLAMPDDMKKEVGLLGGLAIGSLSMAKKPFFSKAAEVAAKEGIPKKPQSIIPFLEKNGVTRAEITQLGLHEFLKGKEKVEPAELQKHIADKGVTLGENVYSSKNKVEVSKQPQFSGYQAIKSQEGVVPGSYAEKFVTADLPTKQMLPFKDMPLNEVIQYLLEKSEITKPIAKLWEEGKLDNSSKLEFSKRYNDIRQREANSSWKDEHSQYSDTKNPMVRIRYDVKELPNGRKVMRLQEIQEPKPVQQARSGEGPVPKDLSDRAMDMGIKQAIADAKKQGLDGIEWSTGEQQRDLYNSALRGVADEARWNPETQELTTYKNGSLTHTEKNVPKEKIEDYIGKSGAERLLKSNSDFTVTQELDGQKRYYVIDASGVRRSGLKFSKDEIQKIADDMNSQPGRLKTATDLTIDAKWPGKLYGDFNAEGGQFDTKATVPSLLKKYGKGEFGVSNPSNPNWKPKEIFQVRNADGESLVREFPTREEANAFIESRPDRDYFINETNEMDVPNLSNNKPAPEQNQPVMWFTKDTPSSFSIYEWAAVTGLSANIIKQFLQLEDGDKRKDYMIKKYPKLKEVT